MFNIVVLRVEMIKMWRYALEYIKNDDWTSVGVICFYKGTSWHSLEINEKNTLEWPRKQFVTTVYRSTLYMSLDDDLKGDLHTSLPCLTVSVYVVLVTSQSIA